ncbi:hypothetical protein Y032_0367g34 [Ancylostoma ceylanicum]|uniref:Protein FMC1 homolog n=1 Tax=Ancylostoma ceylanicum TaxID=53326 RepID=A0A016RUX3_9BILA|nr:hypothetical protein Y032_0367g34 [Ancylostoma ceylanicum]
MLYEFKLSHSAAEAARNIALAFGTDSASERTVGCCFAKFSSGDFDLEDLFIMATAVERSTFTAFRKIVSELRKADKNFTKNSPQYKYLVQQMRDHQVTQRVYSKAPQEAEHVANLYATYLSSTRRLNELEMRYKGGERSVEESANLVGLALPEKK